MFPPGIYQTGGLLILLALLAPQALGQTVGSSRPSAAIPKGSTADGGTIKELRSQRFLMRTDLSTAEGHELLAKLETMYDLIGAYWGAPCRGVVEIYVVKDLKNWSGVALDAKALPSLRSGAGITLGTFLGNDARAVAYATLNFEGTPLHEAVHAYCMQTFGRTGPVWYAEGMAEMGAYWRKGESSVNLYPGVLAYLQKNGQEVKSLRAIVSDPLTTGGGWQAYAWRWALCHLLANNPNYSKDFRPLGLDLLNNTGNSFEKVYGDRADELSFEYRFFLAHIDNGFRNDLAAFDWKKKFLPLRGSGTLTSRIAADRGWQPTAAVLAADGEYDYTATGTWSVAKDGPVLSADGDDAGNGRLVGAMMTKDDEGYKLGEPFELGKQGTLQPPYAGQLWVRCRDKWNELADNKGAMTFKIQLAKN